MKASSSAPAASSPNQQQKPSKPLGSVVVAFFAVIVSLHSMRTSHLKREAELKVEVLEELVAEQRSSLRSLLQPDTLQPLAHDCVERMVREMRENGNQGTNGGGDIHSQLRWGSTANQEPAPESSPMAKVEDAVFEVLRNHIRQRIGSTSMTTEEKNKEALQKLVESSGASAIQTTATAATSLADTQQLPVGTNSPPALENESREGSKTVVKKKLYEF